MRADLLGTRPRYDSIREKLSCDGLGERDHRSPSSDSVAPMERRLLRKMRLQLFPGWTREVYPNELNSVLDVKKKLNRIN